MDINHVANDECACANGGCLCAWSEVLRWEMVNYSGFIANLRGIVACLRFESDI